MDVDFWAARMNSARLRNYDTLSNVENTARAEDVRAWFPCPFCYVEIEIQKLCNHLQGEHCFDFKNAVCPICAATLGKDPLGHFMVQHAQSVKRRRKYLKSGFWNNTTGKDPHEINSLFCTNLGVDRSNVQEPAPDPLLLPFVCSVAPSDPKDGPQDNSLGSVAATPDVESCNWNKQRIYVGGVLSFFHNPKQVNFLRNQCMPFNVDSASFWCIMFSTPIMLKFGLIVFGIQEDGDEWTVMDTLNLKQSSKLPVSDPALEEEYEEKRQRAAFLQDLIASTIF